MSPRITKDEIALIKRAKAGDELAFSALYNRYKEFVVSILIGYIKDADEANDIANLVFLKVHNKLSQFKAYDSFGGWLRIITNRTAVDYLRETKEKMVSFEQLGERLPESEEVENSTESDLVNQMTYNQILDYIKSLPHVHRKICMLFYANNMTVEEISKALKVPKGTIKSVLFRTRSKLKKSLNI